MVKAIWNGTIIAESDEIIEIEGNQYFPRHSVNSKFLVESPAKSTCPWKGTVSYFTLAVDGERNEGAAWCYANPLPAAAEIKNYVAFWHGVEVISG